MRPALARWSEAGLAAVLLLLPPVLVLAPHGATPLAVAGGLCAAGLLAATPGPLPPGWRRPAALLAALVLWGAVSAIWSIAPGRSLILAARLLGMFAAGIALALAAPRVAAPRRLVLALACGTAVALALAIVDYVTDGGVLRHFHTRPYWPMLLDRFLTISAILALPLAAALGRLSPALGVAAAVVMAAAVFGLVDTGAKLALAVALPVAALAWWRQRATARVAAVLGFAAIVAAPLLLPPLAAVPGAMRAADSVKASGGHRLLIWQFAGARIVQHPILGWGLDASRAIPGGEDAARAASAAHPEQDQLPLHPHDAALQVWLELGVVGAALAGLFVGLLWWRLGDAAWPPLHAAAAAGGLAAALVIAAEAYGVWQEWWLGSLALVLFATLATARGER
jgi:O-antigen ligase